MKTIEQDNPFKLALVPVIAQVICAAGYKHPVTGQPTTPEGNRLTVREWRHFFQEMEFRTELESAALKACTDAFTWGIDFCIVEL